MINTPMLSWRAGNDPGSRIKDLVSSLCILLGASFCFFDRVFLFVDLQHSRFWLYSVMSSVICPLCTVFCHLLSRMKLHAKVSCSIKLAGPAASG
jgi:hypothetical protein